MDALSGVRLRDRAAFFDGVLVVADLHVGRGATSDVELPVGDGADMADRFRQLCRQFEPDVAVVAGDLLHSFSTVPGSISETVDGIEMAAAEVGAAVVVTPGNHDTLLDTVWSGRIETEFRHGETVVCHGHVDPEADAERYVVGHDHPTIEIEGRRHPCWLAGETQYREPPVLAGRRDTVPRRSGGDAPIVQQARPRRPDKRDVDRGFHVTADLRRRPPPACRPRRGWRGDTRLPATRRVPPPALISTVWRRSPLVSLSLRGWLALMYRWPLLVGMLENLTTTCEAEGCDRPLSASERMLVFSTDAGERRAYECDCGAVTVTVTR